jgi:hypothetical protein
VERTGAPPDLALDDVAVLHLGNSTGSSRGAGAARWRCL